MFDGDNISKGLLVIGKELGLISDDQNPKLAELREIISRHPTFDTKTKLDRLAADYNVKIIWCPKFHCELNPIEGLWCHSKQHVRSENEQDFGKLLDLIKQSFQNYKESTVNVKLWNRFWEALSMYDTGATYAEVLLALFGAKSSAVVAHHKKK